MVKNKRKFKLSGGMAYLHYCEKGYEPNLADKMAMRYTRRYLKFPLSETDITWSNTDITELIEHAMEKKRKGNILFDE